jgi:hypothetical protein
MAAKKSKQYPYQWPDGSWHSDTWAQHVKNLQASATVNGLNPVVASGGAALGAWNAGVAAQNAVGGFPLPGGLGTAPVAVPAPTAAVGGDGAQPQPEDPFLASQRLAATNNIKLGDAESAWQQGQLQRQSGFDATGNLVTSGADYNPFSQAMQLQDSWHANKLGTTNSLAAQGQLYSGAMVNAQGAADKGYAQGYDALRTGTLGGYHGIQAGRLSNYASNTLGTGSADFTSLYKQLYGN